MQVGGFTSGFHDDMVSGVLPERPAIRWGAELGGHSSSKVRRRTEMADVHDLEQTFKHLVVTHGRSKERVIGICESPMKQQANRNRLKHNSKGYRSLRCLTIQIPTPPVETKGRKRLVDSATCAGRDNWSMCDEIVCEKMFHDCTYRKIWSCGSENLALKRRDLPPHPRNECHSFLFFRMELFRKPTVSKNLSFVGQQMRATVLPDILETDDILMTQSSSVRMDEEVLVSAFFL
jgi:hypothetical protein